MALYKCIIIISIVLTSFFIFLNVLYTHPHLDVGLWVQLFYLLQTGILLLFGQSQNHPYAICTQHIR